jgi:hypothetical protein
MKLSTPILLTIISVADVVFGTGGFVCLILWGGYGFYKLETER